MHHVPEQGVDDVVLLAGRPRCVVGDQLVDRVRVGADTAASAFPLGDRPAVFVVGVERDRAGLGLDRLQCGDEVLWRLRRLGDPRLLPDLLVVDHALGVAGDRQAVALALVRLLVGDEAVLALHLVNGAQRLEERGQLVRGHRPWDQQDVAVVLGVHPDPDLVLVGGDRLELDLDSGVLGLELLLVVLEHVVDQVGALGQDRDLSGRLVTSGRALAAAAARAQRQRRDGNHGRHSVCSHPRISPFGVHVDMIPDAARRDPLAAT